MSQSLMRPLPAQIHDGEPTERDRLLHEAVEAIARLYESSATAFDRENSFQIVAYANAAFDLQARRRNG